MIDLLYYGSSRFSPGADAAQHDLDRRSARTRADHGTQVRTFVVLRAVGVVDAITYRPVVLANGRENFTLHAELNWHVLAVAVGLSVLTGILFGLARRFNRRL